MAEHGTGRASRGAGAGPAGHTAGCGRPVAALKQTQMRDVRVWPAAACVAAVADVGAAEEPKPKPMPNATPVPKPELDDNPAARERYARRMAAYEADPAAYGEIYRPQFHCSPFETRLNDPTGLAFVNGWWHRCDSHDPGEHGGIS